MANTPAGDALLEKRSEAEDVLRRLDPQLYGQVEHWLDKELYGGLYGHSGVERVPTEHLPAIRDLLRARAEVYRGQKNGVITNDRGSSYDGEVGNERKAQMIEACLEALGDGPMLTPDHSWDYFTPAWVYPPQQD